MAFREAICNCYCHRDWTLSGDIKVEYYDDRVMIFSLGSLPNGLTLENIKDGVTAKRNPILVNALNKADFIENYASGVRRIFKDYLGFEKQPEYNISDNAVIVTLYNMNFEKDKYDEYGNRNDTQKNKAVLRRNKLLNLMKHNANITSDNLANILEVSIATVKRDLQWLRKNDLIEYVGSSKNGKWVVK